MNYVSSNSGVVQVQSGSSKQALVAPLQTISKNGYLFVYVSNESPQDVYFDDITVTHYTGALLQEQSYYPFGVEMAAISDKAMNKLSSAYKFNGGDEMEESISMYSTFYRGYDQQLGRFMGVDMLSEKSFGVSSYQFGLNNPIFFNDPLGDKEAQQDYSAFWNNVIGLIDKSDYGGFWSSKTPGNVYEYGDKGAAMEFGGFFASAGGSGAEGSGNPMTVIEAINQLVNKGYTVTDVNYNVFRKGVYGAIIGFNGGDSKNPIVGADFVKLPDMGESSSGLANSSNGFPWGAAAGTVFSSSSFLVYNDIGWYSLKQNKFYSAIFNGNQFTGGKIKFAGTASKILERVGWGLGVWNAYDINKKYQNDEMGTGQMFMEQGMNLLYFWWSLWCCGWSRLGNGKGNNL